jgi:hypothetical protein
LNFCNTWQFFYIGHGQAAFLAMLSRKNNTGAVVMNELLSLNQNCHDQSWALEQVPDALNLHKRILQTERDQIADEDRINDAITRAENDIARLQQRQLGSQQLQAEIITIRDRAVLIVRDVRKNMQRRNLTARRMEECLNDDFLRRRSRFSRDDFEDETLRSNLLQLLERAPTSSLIGHLRDAVEVGEFACAELIRFEFRCRDDKDQFRTDFESIVEKLSRDDPVEMRKRLANICTATERVDARVTELLQRARLVLPPELSMSAVA